MSARRKTEVSVELTLKHDFPRSSLRLTSTIFTNGMLFPSSWSPNDSSGTTFPARFSGQYRPSSQTACCFLPYHHPVTPTNVPPLVASAMLLAQDVSLRASPTPSLVTTGTSISSTGHVAEGSSNALLGDDRRVFSRRQPCRWGHLRRRPWR
ncbi:uncharacterized protein BDZ99DRAFT_531143 [Mytilinidion resinicola]|uniref:Uncharacterized protein n=1 Tax=Mytilinidion resinicola TaxID=574789 RepID=A0A6A6ZC67_9PEZI|nr:uncharacterized protein BDZ99DRAFT_531143 [Mytilinidion resinicola]KAF2817914.1 hypothetical protein BDZ99DRAFT_531143 [Mytilinidion resinicola]